MSVTFFGRYHSYGRHDRANIDGKPVTVAELRDRENNATRPMPATGVDAPTRRMPAVPHRPGFGPVWLARTAQLLPAHAHGFEDAATLPDIRRAA